MTTSIMLFAAGKGTRMGDLVKDRPKPMVSVAGQMLLDHALQFTQLPEIGRRVINTHHHSEVLRNHLRNYDDILISDETDMLRETGGGLKKALPLLGGSPVLTMNTDAVWCGPNPVQQVLGAWQDHMEALLLLVPQSQAFGHKGKGDFDLDVDGRLIRAPGAIYTGIQMIRTEGLGTIAETAFSHNRLWDQIASRNGLYGTIYDGQWCDVGQPESIPIAESMLNV